jgi:hypothetical protein
MENGAREKKSKTGRRPKFAEPRRPITVTLPERTLRRLEDVDRDRAHAIVRLADHRCLRREASCSDAVEVVGIAASSGIILVGPMRSLERIDTLRLVEVAPGRFLLTVPSGAAIESLEMGILDALEGLPAEEETERPGLERLRQILSQQRRKKTVSKRELLLIAT